MWDDLTPSDGLDALCGIRSTVRSTGYGLQSALRYTVYSTLYWIRSTKRSTAYGLQYAQQACLSRTMSSKKLKLKSINNGNIKLSK